MRDTLIKNGMILSMDPDIGDFPSGDVLVEEGKVKSVGQNLTAPHAETVDATGMIVLPGLINAHFHGWATALRGMGSDWAGWDFFRTVHRNLATLYTPKDSYLGTLLGSLNQLNSGTTTLFEWCHNNKTPEHTDASIDALFDSGIRSIFGHGTVKPKPREGEPHFSEIPHPIGEIKRLRNSRLSDNRGLVTLAMCILGPDYATQEVTLEDFRMARELDILSSAHIWGRDDRRVKDGYHLIAREGLLGPKHNVVHGNYLDDAELKVIVDSGASVTSTPPVELQSGHGEPLTRRVLALGGRPSLGADLEITVAGDMFHVMRYALQTIRLFDNRERAGSRMPIMELNHLSRQALEWATVNNARALGLGDRIGSLTPGKQADMIMLKTDDLNLFPANNPVQTVVFQAYPANVDTVWVAGRKVKASGQLLNFPESVLSEKRHELWESNRRLLKDGGLL
jgi:5-methylthioadenosine/S-adenosylhomocysteine deaminase